MSEPRKLVRLEDMFAGPLNETENKKMDQGISELDIKSLVPFKDHPFKLYTGERLENMIDSIRENGVIQPIVVRPIEDGKYEILAGHNRVNASRLAGLTKIRADIRENVSDDEAVLIVTSSNFEQRSPADMLPSELAKSLQMQLEAAKKSGKKQVILKSIELPSNPHEDWVSNASAHGGPRQWSTEKVAENNPLSVTSIKRYIRLNYLIEGLLNEVDSKRIVLVAGVLLSYLKPEEQKDVLINIEMHDFKVDKKKAEILKYLSEKKILADEKIYEVLSGEYGRKPKKTTEGKLKTKLISRFFSRDQEWSEIEQIIEEALEKYFAEK